ncbi:GNAT family N-acetyltransferase [Flammeovirgaceae bacterium SG7u.111]|nr:N-acetyltransferase family protein [Flammeovirgaceae bacterium SG7u.132]WPO37969.1 GNAT family N-acetyltransferase [Flammeovirgaceae bacterium SG7u.111]
MINIRPAISDDFESVIHIYNQAVTSSFCTADTEPVTLEERLDWFRSHVGGAYPIFVAESEGEVLGWISISAYRLGRKALRFAVEVSYYVERNLLGKGIGSFLMDCALKEAKELGYKSIFAILLDRNEKSIALLEKFGFEKWGHLPEICDFDGEICGQFYYGRKV